MNGQPLIRITKTCLNGQRVDSIRYHFRWNMEEIEDILEPNTARVTSIREPLDQFRSAFNFYYYEYRKRVTKVLRGGLVN